MPRELPWRELTVGLVGFATLVALAIATLLFARADAFRGPQFTLYVAINESHRVMQGTEVLLSGQAVGTVRDIRFRPPEAPVEQRVILVLDVQERAREHIRRDAPVRLAAGRTLVAAPVVQVGRGTAAAPAVQPGDTLFAEPRAGLDDVTERLGNATRDLPVVMANLRAIAAHMRGPEGTIGAWRTGEPDGPLEQPLTRVRAVTEGASTPRGTIGLLRTDGGRLQARARGVLARADSVRALVSDLPASLGRFRNDTAFLAHLESIQAEVSTIQELARTPTGTIGRYRLDAALTAGLDSVSAMMDSLAADVRRRPFRYIHF